MEGARQGAEGEGSKEGADLLGGGREEDGHGWEYLCEWEGEQSDSWVWHDKMASVGYVGDLANTWADACARREMASGVLPRVARAPQKAR